MADPSLAVEPRWWETEAPISGDGHIRKHPLENGTYSSGSKQCGTFLKRLRFLVHEVRDCANHISEEDVWDRQYNCGEETNDAELRVGPFR